MLETCVNQAAGLQGLALQVAPRLVAVSSHGQQQGELPLLWGLCASWVELGFPVVVLDGHTHESAKNPGLTQLLDNPMENVNDQDDPVAWSVLPAAQGLAELASAGMCLSAMGELFQNYGVVLIYASASTLTQLFRGSTLAPLLVVSPLKTSSLTAYQALKQLLLDAQLRPTVANIALESRTNSAMSLVSPASNLQSCAMTYLGYAVQPLTITASARPDNSAGDMNRLALRLLENAVFLDRYPILRAH